MSSFLVTGAELVIGDGLKSEASRTVRMARESDRPAIRAFAIRPTVAD